MEFIESWIGVDLDGTLADTRAPNTRHMIPLPVPIMVGRVRAWIGEGKKVKVFTARMSQQPDIWQQRIGDWTQEFIGVRLEATCVKDYGCVELWDDIAVGVAMNTGMER